MPRPWPCAHDHCCPPGVWLPALGAAAPGKGVPVALSHFHCVWLQWLVSLQLGVVSTNQAVGGGQLGPTPLPPLRWQERPKRLAPSLLLAAGRTRAAYAAGVGSMQQASHLAGCLAPGFLS